MTVGERAGMKSNTQYLWFCTKNRQEFVNITLDAEKAVEESSVKDEFLKEMIYIL